MNAMGYRNDARSTFVKAFLMLVKKYQILRVRQFQMQFQTFIPGMDDQFRALQRPNCLGPQQAMGIRNDADLMRLGHGDVKNPGDLLSTAELRGSASRIRCNIHFRGGCPLGCPPAVFGAENRRAKYAIVRMKLVDSLGLEPRTR